MTLPFSTVKTRWPVYSFASTAHPEAVRQSHCFPPEAQEVGKKILPVGWRRDDLPEPAKRRAVEEAMIYDQNVSIHLRDGIQLKADIFRSVKTEPSVVGREEEQQQRVPTVLMYGPYGKTGTGPQQLERLAPQRLGIHFAEQSGLENFEGLDPVEWIPRGYAIVNCDSRGAWQSQADIHWAIPDKQAGEDGYDVVQWIARQPWSNGKVTMAGNSRLATVQYFVAAEQPPALACIAPWEGIVDEYRSALMRGGRPNFAFNNFIIDSFIGTGKIKDCRKTTLLPEHLYEDEWWAHLRPDISKINCPMYVIASYTSGLHCVGSVQIFRDAPSNDKFLRFHDSQEWYDISRRENLDHLQAFYDCHMLSGEAQKLAKYRWKQMTPAPVRHCILPFGEPTLQTAPRGIAAYSDCYPANPSKLLCLYLMDEGVMTDVEAEAEHSKENVASWDSQQSQDCASFTWKATQRIILSGMPTVTLYVSPESQTSSGDEMDIYMLLKKLDKNGNEMVHLSVPLEDLQGCAKETSQKAPEVFDDVPRVQTMKYYGPTGIMRLSHRTISRDVRGKEIELIPGYPHHPHTKGDVEAAKAEQRKAFSSGVPVGFKTGLWPIGMALEEGEGLRLEVGGTYLWAPEFEMLHQLQLDENENRGRHRVHFGRRGALGLSRVVLPVVDLELSTTKLER